MTRCPDTGTLQDHLEGLLAPREDEALRRHVAECPRCAVERVRLEALFARLDGLPLEAPSPVLADRVLDRVLPARRRVRWLRRLGVGYAASLAGCVALAGVWATQPPVRALGAWLAAEASARVFHSLMFLLNAASVLAINLAGGWGALSAIGSHVSPLARALLAVADQRVVQLSLAAAAVLCLTVVWSLRSRTRPSEKGVPHVGVLGF